VNLPLGNTGTNLIYYNSNTYELMYSATPLFLTINQQSDFDNISTLTQNITLIIDLSGNYNLPNPSTNGVQITFISTANDVTIQSNFRIDSTSVITSITLKI
jgi:hypothetical protein